MHIGLSDQKRKVVAEGLSGYLADVYALYLKTQNFHWNLTGQEFYSLHLLFEKHYEAMAEEVDEIAERIRALGFYVDATFTAFKRLTEIKEGKALTIKKMLQELIEGHETLIRKGREVAETGDKDKDFATVDILGKRLGMHEKMLWMLRSQL